MMEVLDGNMQRKNETLTYEITSAPQASFYPERAVAVVYTEKHLHCFFERHADHQSKRNAELAAVARAEKHAKEHGYVAR